MPPAYVKPYVKRHKNDAVDAEAICEAVTRANMRFVATKTPEQQSCLTLHRTRHLFIRQQTSVIMHPGPILRSSASSRRSDAMVSNNCSRLPRIRVTNDCPRWPVRASPPLEHNCRR